MRCGELSEASINRQLASMKHVKLRQLTQGVARCRLFEVGFIVMANCGFDSSINTSSNCHNFINCISLQFDFRKDLGSFY